MFFTSFKPTISAFTTSTFIAAEKKAIAQCLDWMTVSEVEGHLRREQRCRVPTTEVWYTHYMWHTWFDCRRMSVDHGASTAPKCHGDPILSKMGTQFWVRWGPNRDLRQQKWGPKKRIFENWSKQANFLKYRGEELWKNIFTECGFIWYTGLCHFHWIDVSLKIHPLICRWQG